MSFKLGNTPPPNGEKYYNSITYFESGRITRHCEEHLATWQSDEIASHSFAMTRECGRSLMEMLATLSIMGLLGWVAIKGYHNLVTRVKAQNTAKMIQTLAFERQNSAIDNRTGGRTRVKGPHSDLYVRNGVAGNYSKYFWVETTLKDSAFCEALKESELIQADLVEVNGTIDGTCSDNATLAFYFKKNPSTDETLTWVDEDGQVQKCPKGSATCDSSGIATSCESGYYLVDGRCGQCGAHVKTCEDENTPISCQEGYELHWGQCITPPQMCAMDSDCDVCATCDTETGRCQNSCEVPTQRCGGENECGTNECIICDTATQTCKYACEKVEYLRSTGSQWIDTGIKPASTQEIESIAEMVSSATSSAGIIGSGTTSTSNDRVQIWAEASAQSEYFYSFRIDGSYQASTINPKAVHKIVLDIKNRACYIDDIKIGDLNYTGSLSNYNYFLFLRNEGGTPDRVYRQPVRIYKLKIGDNGILVRDFIPVHAPFQPVGKQNCMFDRVTKKLFCNQGSGDDFLTD